MEIEDADNLDFKNVVDASTMFKDCPSLRNIDELKCENVTDWPFSSLEEFNAYCAKYLAETRGVVVDLGSICDIITPEAGHITANRVPGVSRTGAPEGTSYGHNKQGGQHA